MGNYSKVRSRVPFLLHALSKHKVMQAIEYHQRGLAISQEHHDRYREALAHSDLGSAYQAYGDFKQSAQHHEQHLAIMLDLSEQAGLPAAHESLGRLYERLTDYRRVCINCCAAL